MRRLQLFVVITALCLQQAPAEAAGFQVHQDQVSVRQARLLSVLYPGLGQLAAGHRERGTAMIVGHTTFLVGWLSSHSDYGTHEKQFKLETARYLSLREGGSFTEADEAWTRLKDRKDDLDRSHLIRTGFAALSVALYTYNLIDVLWMDGVQPPQMQRVSLTPQTIGEAPGLALVARWR